MYLRVHELLECLPLHRYPFVARELPGNGLYFFYEEGEFLELGGVVLRRIVRVGTHSGDGRLPQRLANHFRGSRASSVFRRHPADALLAAAGVADLLVPVSLGEEVEALVSDVLRRRFSFRAVEVPRPG